MLPSIFTLSFTFKIKQICQDFDKECAYSDDINLICSKRMFNSEIPSLCERSSNASINMMVLGKIDVTSVCNIEGSKFFGVFLHIKLLFEKHNSNNLEDIQNVFMKYKHIIEGLS